MRAEGVSVWSGGCSERRLASGEVWTRALRPVVAGFGPEHVLKEWSLVGVVDLGSRWRR